MFRWAAHPFLRITLFFIAGLLVTYVCDDFVQLSVFPWLFFFLIIAVVLNNRRWFSRFNSIIGILCFLMVALLGVQRMQMALNLPSIDISNQDEISYYVARIVAFKGETTKTHKFDIEVEWICDQNLWVNSSGMIRLYIYKDSTSGTLAMGDKVIILGSPKSVGGPNNPGEFNFQRFLSFEKIHHQHFISSHQLRVYNAEKPWNIKTIAHTLRNSCDESLKKYILNDRERAVASALILGQKNDLDDNIKKAYSASGAMHILAVSGLHVGIIYGLIYGLLGWLRTIPQGRLVFAVLSLAILWFYAVLTGLSPSVLRAVVMFTFIIIASAIRGQTNIYNTLAGSAFLLIVYNPLLLFSVGFQLSYAAVFGIVYLQPKLYEILTFKNYIVDKVWALSAVSIAAQIATFPLAVFYFDRFPNLFLITNLVVIPAAFIILSLGLLTIAISFFEPIARVTGIFLEFILFSVNDFVEMIEGFTFASALFYLESIQVVLIYVVIFFFLLFLKLREIQYLFITFLGIASLSIYSLNRVSETKAQKRVVFYSISGHESTDWIQGTNVLNMTDTMLAKYPSKILYSVTPNRFELGIESLVEEELDVSENELIKWNGKSFFFLGNDRAFPDSTLNDIDYLILRNNQKVNLTLTLNKVKFRELVIGSSYKKYLAERLRNQAEQLNLSTHSIPHDGALVINL